MAGINSEFLSDHKLFRTRHKKIIALFPLIAVLVAIIVFWCLKLIGITVTSDALCGVDEHIHSEECYSESSISDTDTSEYISEKTLICTKPEHTHSAECFPDKSADTETAADWIKTFEDVQITNNVSENLLAIASSQIGYTESNLNYEYNSIAEKNGYTRYGEWYGNPYGNWNSVFVSFCLNYANANNADSLKSASAESMRLAWEERHLYSSSAEYICSAGDVIFFDTDSDGKADRTGIVMFAGNDTLITVEGDVEGAVEKVVYQSKELVMGYGRTGELYAANHIDQSETETSVEPEKVTDISGQINHYVPDENSSDLTHRNVFNSDPLVLMSADDHTITRTHHLEGEVIDVVFKEQSGTVIGSGNTVYIGETYIVALEFSEINTGTNWIQFEHNEDGFLTYHIPENLHCEPFDSWHTISATTEGGTAQDVGEYFVDENGLLRVRFYEDDDGVNFVDKYANVDFTIEFNATVASTQTDDNTIIDFGNEIKVDFNVDKSATLSSQKTHGTYDSATNTLEYTVRVEATHGIVHDLVVTDEIWESHHALRDTIVVTDLNGNLLDPQPTISDPAVSTSAGFSLSGFPDVSAGDGFIITYKSAINNNLLGNDKVGLWNGLTATGKDSKNENVSAEYTDDWTEIELEKMVKNGKQAVLEDANGNKISVIEWQIGIRKTDANLQGTVVVDTLGDGLAYYTGQPIIVKRYDEWGNSLPDSTISWNNVTINGNSMEFPLPDSFACDIIYYTTFEELDAGEEKNYTNHAKVTINGKVEQTQGSANVVGFIPRVEKTAYGDDGEYVYFTIEADVPAAIKDWGYFYLTDLAAFWGYNGTADALYIENIPENLVVSAKTESGQIVVYTPYREGGTTENTYKLVSPVVDAGGEQHHSFKILFNTAYDDNSSSKWNLNEDSVLTITYRIPFDAATGSNWYGEFSDYITVEDALLSDNTLSNEVYFNYTQTITEIDSANYEYSPMLIKKSIVHEDGKIDYTVTFNNNVPGSGGANGYLNGSIVEAWFNDTFDERMEYVPGSLIVTGYSPWQEDLWIKQFKYDGTVTGNTIRVSSDEFLSYNFNPNAHTYGWGFLNSTYNLTQYYQWLGQGGKFVFTYTLKVKDEYLYTNEHAKIELDNTAEITWSDGGSSGPATETSRFVTGLVEKTTVQENTKLDFDIHINRNALDILPDSDTLTIEDTMTTNLSVYWETIKLLYQDTDGNWIDFNSPQSKYTYTVTYDPPTNKLTFVIPDSLHIRIDYTTLITESGMVSINNSVSINGKAEVSDIVDALFRVEEHSGGASGSNHDITLLKQDGKTNVPLPNATFLLYGPVGDPDAVIPDGVSKTITTDTGRVLRFIGSYTTGENGTAHIETQYLTLGGPYALIEQTAPQGYSRLENPVYFYFYELDPNGIIQTVTTLIVVENFSGGALIPETGGFGVLPTAILGTVLVTVPVLYVFIRRKRERRFVT